MTRRTFDFGQYEALLDALAAGGYRPCAYGPEAVPDGGVLLRHDVDKSPAMALAMAEREWRRGVKATYFFLLRSPLYGLLEPDSLAAVRAIAAMGHDVGLHCDVSRMPHAEAGQDERIVAELALFESVTGLDAEGRVSFHNPPAEVLRRDGAGYVSAYAPRFMPDAVKYISDSNAHWREGDPKEALTAGAWRAVQILVHPLWWARPEPVDVTAALADILARRAEGLDAYLQKSNDLWREACAGEER